MAIKRGWLKVRCFSYKEKSSRESSKLFVSIYACVGEKWKRNWTTSCGWQLNERAPHVLWHPWQKVHSLSFMLKASIKGIDYKTHGFLFAVNVSTWFFGISRTKNFNLSCFFLNFRPDLWIKVFASE